MPPKALILDGLTASEALELLDEAALEGDALGELRLATSEKGAFQASAAWAIPIEALEEARHPLGRMAGLYERRRPQGPKRAAMPEEARPVGDALGWLLINAAGEQEPSQPIEGEFLLVSQDPGQERAGRLFESAMLHATDVTVAGAESPVGRLCLLHVLADSRRRSSFQGALRGEAFEGCALLAAHSGANHERIFLPPDVSTGRKDIARAARILRRAETYFAPGGRRMRDARRLAAVLPAPSTPQKAEPDRYLFLYLASLRFRSKLELAPPSSYHARFKLLELQDSEAAMKRLQAELERQAPQAGYRLELAPAPDPRTAERRRLRLRERQAEIEYQLALLDSIAPANLSLLRFSARQLPALADVLRGFPREALRNGSLRYAFQAGGGHGEGRHYLLVDSRRASMLEVDPLLLWEDEEGPALRFRLDPSFARDYAGGEDQPGGLVFVPEGAALFPPLHTWEVEEMGAFLRRLALSVIPQADRRGVPDRPVFVFEGPAGPGEKLTASVLDRDRFAPLQARLGWLNDNLILEKELSGQEERLRELAREARRRRLHEELSLRADQAEDAFRAAAEESRKGILSLLDELTQGVEDEVASLTEDTFQAVTEIRRLSARLEALAGVRREMKQTSREIDQLHEEVFSQAAQLRSRIDNFEESTLEPLLKRAQATRQRIEARVEEGIEKLLETRRRLLRRLKGSADE